MDLYTCKSLTETDFGGPDSEGGIYSEAVLRPSIRLDILVGKNVCQSWLIPVLANFIYSNSCNFAVVCSPIKCVMKVWWLDSPVAEDSITERNG